MENHQKGFVKLFVVILILIAVGAGIYWYYSKGSIVKETFSVPDVLGDYAIQINNTYKVQIINTECRKVEDNSDLKKTGLTGEACSDGMRVEYRQINGNNVVFVNFVNVTKGNDLYKALLGKISKQEKLNDYDVFRVEKHEIVWFPKSKFNVIFTQEGTYKVGPDNSAGYNYTNAATGNNPVTQYFINKYPPTANTL